MQNREHIQKLLLAGVLAALLLISASATTAATPTPTSWELGSSHKLALLPPTDGTAADDDSSALTVDTTPPSEPIIFSISLADNQTLIVNGLVAPGVTVEVSINGTIQTTQAGSDGGFEISAPLLEGLNVVAARAKDQAGNYSPVVYRQIAFVSGEAMGAGETWEADFTESGFPIYKISITAKQAVTPVILIESVEVWQTEIEPLWVVDEFNIILTNLTEKDIENATIEFRVRKFWVEQNNVDSSTIRLMVYREGEWQMLPQEATGEDDEYTYYAAEVSRFSTFAVVGETLGVQLPTEGETQSQVYLVAFGVIATFAISALGAALVAKNRFKSLNTVRFLQALKRVVYSERKYLKPPEDLPTWKGQNLPTKHTRRCPRKIKRR